MSRATSHPRRERSQNRLKKYWPIWSEPKELRLGATERNCLLRAARSASCLGAHVINRPMSVFGSGRLVRLVTHRCAWCCDDTSESGTAGPAGIGPKWRFCRGWSCAPWAEGPCQIACGKTVASSALPSSGTAPGIFGSGGFAARAMGLSFAPLSLVTGASSAEHRPYATRPRASAPRISRNRRMLALAPAGRRVWSNR